MLTRRLCQLLLFLVVFHGLPCAGAQAGTASDAPSLAAVYARGVRDTNADGLADAIVARIIVPARPTIEDVEAATNIAARLGYETTAATLPAVLRDDEVSGAAGIALPILVGRENRFVKALVAKGALEIGSLAAGQGLVALVPAPLGGPAGVVAVGADDAGTLSASAEIAARLPRLWNMTGVTLVAAEEQTLEYLEEHGISATEASVTSIVVDSDRRGIATLGVQVRVTSGEEARAIKVLEDLDAAHRFGRDLGTLNFAAAATTTVSLVTSRGPGGRASVHRSGVNWRTLTPPPAIQPGPGASTPFSESRPVEANTVGRPRCAYCIARYDGTIPGGGGAGYGPTGPTGVAPVKAFDLADAYSISGWFGDVYRDLIPDSTETNIVVGGNPRDALGAAHIAARLGLETTGITLPIAKRDIDVRQAQNEPSPILVGRDNTLVQALAGIGKVRLSDLQPGDGVVELVPRAFGTATATVVAGADAAGADAASLQLARRLPYLWDIQRGAPTLQDLKNEAADFFAARSSAGQAAQASNELRAVVHGLALGGAKVESINASVYLEEADAGVQKFLEDQIREQLGGDTRVSVVTQAIRDPVTVFDDRMPVPWEVDEFWAKFKSDVLPNAKVGSNVRLEARLSEDPNVRERIAAEATAELTKAGAANPTVHILSAYKQGYFWLVEQVIPELKGKDVKTVHIKVRGATPDLSQKYKLYELPSRWVKELYPADEIFKRELGLPLDEFQIEQVEDAKTIYDLEAIGADGKVLYTSTFDPSAVKREYFDILPGWSRMEAESGQISATVDGRPVASARIETDLERVWDYYQATVLPKLRDYILHVSGGHPTPGSGPLFRDFNVQASLSEPDYDIGVDGEHISSVEALSHNLYMVTSQFLGTIGAPSAGRVTPLVQPTRAGHVGEARFILTRNSAAGGRIELTYKIAGGAPPVTVSRDLGAIQVSNPKAVRVVARADCLREVELQVEADNDAAVARATDAVQTLVRLQRAGLYKTTLSYAHVGRIAVAISSARGKASVIIPNTGYSDPTNVHKTPSAPRDPVVTWDHVISPAESEEIIRKLAYFPAVAAYRAGRSYEGHDISVMEITEPTPSEQVSIAKLSAYKPTLMAVGRQHGNERSSTMYILRLGERLATDPAFADFVKKVNVILLPVMNPDGATLAMELQKLRPKDLSQPGYLSALGRDVTAGKLPETEVDPKLWRLWLPDIYLNNHGAASHEVPMPFSGYANTGAPTYTFKRGWYFLSFFLPQDARDPAREEVSLALRDAVAREVNSNPEARARNVHDYERFGRWGYGVDSHLEPMELNKGVMMFYDDPESSELLGMRRIAPEQPDTPEANREASMWDWPTVTLDAGTVEAPDEGALGDLLKDDAQSGFAMLIAHLKYLRDGEYKVQRIEEDAPGDGATLTTLRVRPVMPPKTQTVQ